MGTLGYLDVDILCQSCHHPVEYVSDFHLRCNGTSEADEDSLKKTYEEAYKKYKIKSRYTIFLSVPEGIRDESVQLAAAHLAIQATSK